MSDALRINRSGAARQWFDRGWHPFPLPAGEKDPPPAGVTGRDGRDLALPDIMLADWTGNIGVRMAWDEIGLDVDDYDDKPGAATLDKLTLELGPLPPTVMSSSGRKDRSGIRFYRTPPGLRWIANLPGIDIIQRNHRYAAVWPSIHPSGRQYVLIDEASGEPCEVPDVADLPELPWAWIEYLSRATDDELDKPARSIPIAELQAFIERTTEALQPGYVNVIVGHFNDHVDAGHSRHDTMQHCLTWAMESAAAGLFPALMGVDRLAAAWTPRHTDKRRAEPISGTRTTEFEAMLRHAIGKALSKTVVELRMIRENVVGITIGLAELPPPPKERSSIWVDWRKLWDDENDERDWLVEGFWPTMRAMALWAPAKKGKSELALFVAAMLAEGIEPFTGARRDPVNVAYFDYEMGEPDLRERLASFGLYRREFPHLHYMILPPIPALDLEAGGEMIADLAQEVDAAAVIIDTFGRAVSGDENEADTVRAFYRHTGSRLKQRQIGYLRTDHAGKDVSKGQRGSSAKRDDVDIIWQMSRGGEEGVVLDCSGSSRLSWVGPKLDLVRYDRDDKITYRLPSDRLVTIVTDEVAAIVAAMDAANIPTSWGRERVRADGGIKGRNDDISAAIKVRKARQAPGTVSGTV